MKKIFAVAVALMMVMALSVSAFADEVLFTHDFSDAHDDGWWEDSSTNGLSSDQDLVAAINTSGAKLVIVADAANVDGADGHGFQYGFQDTSSWVNILVHSNFANGEGNLGAESAVEVDGKAVITVDCAALAAAIAESGAALTSYNWINGASTGDTFSISVVIPDAAAEPEAPAAEPEAPAAEPEAPAAEPEAPAAAETPASPNTGLALAVVPAIVAMAAAVVSKKR